MTQELHSEYEPDGNIILLRFCLRMYPIAFLLILFAEYSYGGSLFDKKAVAFYIFSFFFFSLGFLEFKRNSIQIQLFQDAVEILKHAERQPLIINLDQIKSAQLLSRSKKKIKIELKNQTEILLSSYICKKDGSYETRKLGAKVFVDELNELLKQLYSRQS